MGDVYPETQYVRFFMEKKDIPQNTYRVMGTAIAAINDDDAALCSGDVLSDTLRQKAMSVGADAIFIQSRSKYKVGTRVNTNTSTDYVTKERSKSRSHHGRHHSHGSHRSTTRTSVDSLTTTSDYDVYREEIHAQFLKLKTAK